MQDDLNVARAQHLRCFNQRSADEACAAIRIDQTGRESPGKNDQDRSPNAGAEPQRRERNPSNGSDEPQRVENGRYDLVKYSKPTHQEPEWDTDSSAEQKAIGKTDNARCEMLLQGGSGEWARKKLDKLPGDLIG